MWSDYNAFTTFIKLRSSSTSEDLPRKNITQQHNIWVPINITNRIKVTARRRLSLTCITSSIPRSRHPPAFGSYIWVPWRDEMLKHYSPQDKVYHAKEYVMWKKLQTNSQLIKSFNAYSCIQLSLLHKLHI